MSLAWQKGLPDRQDQKPTESNGVEANVLFQNIVNRVVYLGHKGNLGTFAFCNHNAPCAVDIKHIYVL